MKWVSVLALLCLLSGCKAEKAPPNGWAYAELSRPQQGNYRAVCEAVEQGWTTESTGITVLLPVPLADEAAVRELYTAVMRDNPAYFFIGTDYGYTGERRKGEQQITELTLTYTMTAEQRIRANRRLERVREVLLDVLEPTMSDFEKERLLHDSLTALCTYGDAESAEAFTALGALVDGKAVCEGYARAMQYLLHAAEIPATVVTGTDDEGRPHMWNMVRLEGEIYHVDATWNDRGAVPVYTYFNLNTEEIGRSRRLGREALTVSSTATEQNFYHKTGAYIGTADVTALAKHIADARSAGVIHLRFSDEAFTTASVFVQSRVWFTQTVNAFLGNKPPISQDYAVILDETYKTITISEKTS